MACCGQRRKGRGSNTNKISVNIKRTNENICPMCRSVMKSLHRFDKSIKKVLKSWYCTKPSCPNSRGIT